jgi:eukaryotic-like serine/threonine-protein kinase
VRHDDDGTTVALKVMKRDLIGDEVYGPRFAHEARSAAEVHHEHLVPILDAGEVEGCGYLAVGYVPGRTLLQVASG